MPPSMLPRTPEEVFKALKDQPFQFEPGSATRYTQTNYLLLKQIIEKVTGHDFVQVVTEGTLAPLGLKHVRYGGEHDLVPGRATSYRGSPKGLRVDGGFDFPDYAYPNAGLNADALELATWMRALLAGKLVSATTLKSLWPRPAADDGSAYSNGWEYSRSGDLVAVGHSGGGKTDLRHFFRDGSGHSVTVIYLSNGSEKPFSPPELSARLADVLLPGAISPQQKLKDAMLDALAAGDSKAAVARYRAFRAAKETREIPMENALNLLGYEVMMVYGPKQALTVFELNVEDHPDSGNAHDSLGEAYLGVGDLEHAREHYARAAELDPQNANARRILADLNRRQGPGQNPASAR